MAGYKGSLFNFSLKVKLLLKNKQTNKNLLPNNLNSNLLILNKCLRREKNVFNMIFLLPFLFFFFSYEAAGVAG